MSTAIDSPRSILSTHPGSFDAPSIRTADDWFSLRDAPPFNPSPPSHRSGNSGETQPVAAELENHDGELEQLEVQELDSKKRKGGFEEKTHAWDTILKRYMAGIGIGPIDEESPGTDGTPSMRTLWIESPCHSRRPSETFTRSEIDAVNETVVDRSDFGDDNTKANKPGTVDSPTIKDQYHIDGFESHVRESIDGSESSFVQIDHPTAGVSVPTGPSEAAWSSTSALRGFLSNTLLGGGRSGQSQAKIRSRL
ncbi:hypothetical protein JCM24511_05555 [Saitozyma sp. JCM 24511]|nr:hypothetical protein JCM24511_05555 [Saitozyma sp. JCM 24511]